jgi:hypothetical protein
LVVTPFGACIVKITTAPATGVGPMATVAAIGATELVLTGFEGTETVTAKTGAATVLTVALAVPVEEFAPLAAIAFTE